MSCVHCHVNAGPHRTEMMNEATAELVIKTLNHVDIACLDLTGGAPELNPHFRRIVKAARSHNIRVIDRCNLTILFEPNQEDLATFLADQGVEIVASLPCYLEDNVNQQRGNGTYSVSIEALKILNQLGYGYRKDLKLDLVFNPQGPQLPPNQTELEIDYKRELGKRFGIVFNNLFTITNMPINRFGAILLAKGQFDEYMDLLQSSYSDRNLDTVMCRDTISVDWEGNLYDCDFNQMLGMKIPKNDRSAHLRDLVSADRFTSGPICTGQHCYGCTAGQGSSCTGALVN